MIQFTIGFETAITTKDAEALTMLAERQAKEGAVFVEVGSWTGFSSCTLGVVVARNGGHLYCVDHWNGSPMTTLFDEAAQKDIYHIFEENLKSAGLWDHVTPIKSYSVDASKGFDDNSIDFLFIDADHRYKEFKKDLEAWMPKVKPGGVMCGHDCEAYYSMINLDTRNELDKNLNMDCPYGYHIGVIRGLYDVFHDEYSAAENSTVWFREM